MTLRKTLQDQQGPGLRDPQRSSGPWGSPSQTPSQGPGSSDHGNLCCWWVLASQAGLTGADDSPAPRPRFLSRAQPQEPHQAGVESSPSPETQHGEQARLGPHAVSRPPGGQRRPQRKVNVPKRDQRREDAPGSSSPCSGQPREPSPVDANNSRGRVFFFKIYLFIYLLGCIGSSLHHTGSFVVVCGLCCST